MKEKLPVVILCGGMGTRLSEETDVRPKPLVEVGNRPLVWHIMKHYGWYGFGDFFLALGYKGEQIKRYFLDFHALSSNFAVSLTDGSVRKLNSTELEPWQVNLIDTGQAALTGSRLKQLQPHLKGGPFLMTYGDGVCNVDLDKLLAFHRSHGGLVTLTAVRPPARFGALDFDGQRIRHFKEKSILSEGWINGGFFIIEPAALERIEGNVMWEHAPMERLAAEGQLFAYQHEGFWQCMDTLRDLRYLESLWQAGNPPWKIW